jgi:potassium-transporting ATPase ATP-binding subunit
MLHKTFIEAALGGVIAPFIGIKLIDVLIDPLLALVGLM